AGAPPPMTGAPARLAAATGLLLALAAWAAAGSPARAASADAAEARLFGGAFADIRQLYVEPLPLRRLALAGLTPLHAFDRRLAVTDHLAGGPADTVTLLYDDRDAADFTMPPPDDPAGWGRLVAGMIGDARRLSAPLGAMPPERIDTIVFAGITGLLDPFSRYVDPAAARADRAARDGFGGVGIALDARDHQLRVADVSPQGPAAQAGIRADDSILAIDGTNTAGWSEEAARDRLRGAVGSDVVLRIRPPSGAPAHDVALRRAYVSEPTVTARRDGDILILRVSSFNRTTAARAAAALTAAQATRRLAGIVLDLRGNPGGLLKQGVGLADLFLASGPIVATAGRIAASDQHFAASGEAIAPNLPLAVLINGDSASAAEIVTAALQDAGRAVVIGSSSYGKGTVQTVLSLTNGGELILTWARLIARGGYPLEHHGVVPTLCTALLPQTPAPLALRMQEAAAVAFAAPQARATLSDSGWQRQRGLCPPRTTRPSIDLALAERVLANPQLYATALAALPRAAP
ncbi:MAG TPA: S41 family peptidase, partial [Stellaceae bacterium]|nr:S41 family peptidase [Stellaceae bacterium]